MGEKCLYQAEDGKPCRQESQIEAIHDTLKELKGVLVQIAEQGVVLKAHADVLMRHEKQFENVYPRLNALEVKAEAQNVRVGFLVAGAASASSVLCAVFMKFVK